jgi:hypothetical protein
VHELAGWADELYGHAGELGAEVGELEAPAGELVEQLLPQRQGLEQPGVDHDQRVQETVSGLGHRTDEIRGEEELRRRTCC